jgi:PAS domain S-box-containing protein
MAYIMPKRDDASKTMLIAIPPAVRSYDKTSGVRPIDIRSSKIPNKQRTSEHEEHSELYAPEIQQLFQGIYDAAFLTEPDGTILDANLRAVQFFQYSRETLQGANISHIITGCTPKILSTICDNLENNQFTLIQASCTREDGELMPTEISTSLLQVNGENRMCFFIRDITARQQAEDALKDAHNRLQKEVTDRTRINEELYEANVQLLKYDEAKSEFVSNVSHELKTPVTSIKYMAGNMLRGIMGDMPEGAVNYLELITKDCRRLARTVEDILDMSRIEANTLALNMMKIPFVRFVKKTVESLRLQAETEGIILSLSIDCPTCFVECDPQRTERAIFNVIKNAIKYNVMGGSVDATLHMDPNRPGFLLIDVVDSGIGIEAKHLSRVTDRFYRVGEYVSGAGLGLALTKDLMDRTGGDLNIQSPPTDKPKGTQVTMSFPITQPTTIFMVYITEDTRDHLIDLMTSHGYQVASVQSGEQIPSFPEGITPDIVVLDWMPEGMDGSISFSLIKEHPLLRALPTVTVTSADPGQTKLEIIEGFNSHLLQEPWTEEALLNSLEEVLVDNKNIK